MSKRKAKRKQRRDWMLVWYRSVGEFKKGERRMLQRNFTIKFFPSWTEANKARLRYRQDISCTGYIHKRGRKPRRITEIQINYPAE